MPIVYYDNMFKYYTQKDQFDASNQMIVTVYKQARKVDNKNRILPFYHESRNSSIYMLDALSDKHKRLFPNGLFLCNDSNDATKSLLFVFPTYNDTIDAPLAQHWHFLIKETKKGKRVGLHETVYITPPMSRAVCDHLPMEYMDPISLPTTRFDTIYARAPQKRDALCDIIASCMEQSGGARKPKRSSHQPGIFKNYEFHKLFTMYETGYKTPGVKKLYVISLKQDDGSYINSIGFVPRGRVKYDDNRVIPTVFFETGNATLSTIRKAVLKHVDQLTRAEDEE